MKYCSLIIFLLFLWSCNGDDKAPVDTQKTDSVSQEKMLAEALKKYPDSVGLIENMSAFYSYARKYDSAISVVNKSIARDSLNPEIRRIKSMVLKEKGDTAGAIASLEDAIRLAPLPQYIYLVAPLYAVTKNTKALQAGNMLTKTGDVKYTEAGYYVQGLYYSSLNMKEKAIPFFDEAIKTDYTFMEAYLEKGLALYDLSKYAEAADVFSKAVTIQNNFDAGYYYLGRCYEKLNRKADAANAYRKALMYDPDYEEAAEALSDLKM